MTEHAPEYVQEEKIISFSPVMILLFTAQIHEKYGSISIILSRKPQFERRIEPNHTQREGSLKGNNYLCTDKMVASKKQIVSIIKERIA